MFFIPSLAVALVCAFAASACGGGSATVGAVSPKEAQVAESQSPGDLFSADSAFSYVKAQVDFGPRTPGSEAHRRCALWIESELGRHGADTVIVQRGQTTQPVSGASMPITNILGRFNPGARERIMLVAHYDTRPWADQESDESLHNTPIDGANDGGSGVGVMLEIARQLGATAPQMGVDLLFVDGEDSGSSNSDDPAANDSWGLGSQYWVENNPLPSHERRPRLVVVLDMVGGIDAKFHREYFSELYYPSEVNRIWGAAKAAGHGNRFINRPGGPIIDDHLPFIRQGIPAIDIVESCSDATGSFPATWHTLSDNLSNISKESLQAAGATMLHVIRRGF